MSQSTHRLSGRQITTMVAAVCAAAVLAPAGVLAASRSTVSIADGKHPSHTATVTKQGAQVVTNTPRLPGTPYQLVGHSGNGTPQTVPAGKHLIVTTVSALVSVNGGTNPILGVQYNNSSDSIDVPLLDQGSAFSQEVYENLLPVDLVLNPGTSLNLEVLSNGIPTTTVYFIGYLV